MRRLIAFMVEGEKEDIDKIKNEVSEIVFTHAGEVKTGGVWSVPQGQILNNIFRFHSDLVWSGPRK